MPISTTRGARSTATLLAASGAELELLEVDDIPTA